MGNNGIQGVFVLVVVDVVVAAIKLLVVELAMGNGY
jgi:hypothetical protein